MVETAMRLRAGESIYPAPSVDFVGYVYTPLYFAIAGALGALTGGDLAAARTVSALAALVSFALVAWWVWRETRSAWAAAAGAGLLAACQGLAGFWYHLARVDSLFLALLLAALLAMACGTRARSAVLAGALGTLAVLTKQAALLALLPALAGLAFVDARRAGIASVTLLGATLVSFAVLTAVTDGWFLYYTVDLPGQHGLELRDALVHGAGRMATLAPACLACGLYLVPAIRRGERRARMLGAMLAGLVLCAWLGLAHPGGHWNVLLPACAGLAIVTPVAAWSLHGSSRLAPAARAAVPLVLALQIALPIVPWPPWGGVAPATDVARGERFVSWLASQPGEPLLPDAPLVEARAGKPVHGLGMAARDVLRARRDDRGRRMLEESLATALADRRFSVIVTTERDWLGGALELAYEPAGRAPEAPRPITGWPSRPTWVWRPRPTPSAHDASEM
jgi:4-amino-4-deoxy-L-arabinose transferase-like glycosyltransferase